MRRAFLAVVLFSSAMGACFSDPGFEIVVRNPCSVAVQVNLIELDDGEVIGTDELLAVDALGSMNRTSIYYVDEVIVEAPELGWEDRQASPGEDGVLVFRLDAESCPG